MHILNDIISLYTHRSQALVDIVTVLHSLLAIHWCYRRWCCFKAIDSSDDVISMLHKLSQLHAY